MLDEAEERVDRDGDEGCAIVEQAGFAELREHTVARGGRGCSGEDGRADLVGEICRASEWFREDGDVLDRAELDGEVRERDTDADGEGDGEDAGEDVGEEEGREGCHWV